MEVAELVEVFEAKLDQDEDARSVVELTDAYARDPIGGGRPLPASVRSSLIAGLRTHPTTIVLLASVGGHAVGLATCFWGFSTFASRPILNIHDLAVRPEHRGRGIGRALLREVERRARERGCVKVTLEVRERNAPARSLYEAEGYSWSGNRDVLGPDLFYSKKLA